MNVGAQTGVNCAQKPSTIITGAYNYAPLHPPIVLPVETTLVVARLARRIGTEFILKGTVIL